MGNISLSYDEIRQIAHGVAIELRNMENQKKNDDRFSSSSVIGKALDIQHYCDTRVNCDECVFITESPNGYMRCILDDEPDSWKLNEVRNDEVEDEQDIV